MEEKDAFIYLNTLYNESERNEKLKRSIRKTFDNSLDSVENGKLPFSKLFMDGFDDEQIWQQIDINSKHISETLKNDFDLLENFKTSIPHHDISVQVKNNTLNREQTENAAGNEFSDQEDIGSYCSEEKDTEDEDISKTRTKDDFLSVDLQEMNAFADKMEADDDDDDMDELYDDVSTNSEESDKNNDIKKVRFEEGLNVIEECSDDYSENEASDYIINEENTDSRAALSCPESAAFDATNNIGSIEQEIDLENASSFQREKIEMKGYIKKLEEKNILEKHWTMKGEASAQDRPVDSALRQDLEFRYGKIFAPIITNETTKKLEDLITRRIKDKAWDDVERKRKPEQDVAVYRLPAVVNSEKSKESLATIYEKEYLSKLQNTDNTTVEDGKVTKHGIIKNMLDDVYLHLDTLTNLNFVPNKPKVEIEMKTNYPTLNMEEPAPVAIKSSTMFAPEEVHGKNPKLLVNRKELSKEERKSFMLKKKKLKIKLNALKEHIDRRKNVNTLSKKQAADRLKKVRKKSVKVETDSKIVKNTDAKEYTSSTAFFNKLQSLSNEK